MTCASSKYSSDPDPKIEFKINYEDEFKVLPQRMKLQRGPCELTQLHREKLKIKKSKFEHLQQLKDVIPRIYHQFYDELPHE